MRHPTEGVLRRLVDEPVGVADADRAHVAGCPTCLAGLEAARADARAAAAALARRRTDAPDVDAAWLGSSAAVPAAARAGSRPPSAVDRRGAPPGGGGPRRGRRPVRGRGRRGQRLAADVPHRAGGARAAGRGRAGRAARPVRLRHLEVTGEGEPTEVADAADGGGAHRPDVPEVADLPTGVTGRPGVPGRRPAERRLHLLGRAGGADRRRGRRGAAGAAAGAGRQPRPVAGRAGRGRRSGRQPSGLPVLAVGRAVAPTADSDGVPFETVRDYLLSLPGMPDRVADQLRDFSADARTLPLPVPADMVTTSTAEVAGEEATVLTRGTARWPAWCGSPTAC